MVQSAETNVISPTIATHDPDALLYQRIRDAQQIARFRLVTTGEFRFQFDYQFAFHGEVCFITLRFLQKSICKLFANQSAHSLDQLFSVRMLMIDSYAHAKSELRIVLKQRVAPRRTATVAIGRVRSCGQIAAVNTRT